MSGSTSLSADIYNNAAFAQQYAQNIVDNAWNAYYERPASLSLLPAELQGKAVLDAGFGPGITAEYFLNHGATVAGVDYSKEMLAIARERIGDRASLIHHDLNQPLHFFEPSTFDIIYCSLVIHYIDDLDVLFREFARVLKPEGVFVFSTDHPEAPHVKNYPVTSREVKSFFWDGFGVHVPVYMRPWNEFTESLQNNHFVIDKTITPVPTEECRVKFPDIFERLMANPNFICVRAINKKANV